MQLKQVVFLGWQLRKLAPAFFFMLYILSFNGWRVFSHFRPEKGKGKPGQFGSSTRDWYSGWNCMKTLVSRGLVVKSSCPAKYGLGSVIILIIATFPRYSYFGMILSICHYIIVSVAAGGYHLIV